MQGPFLQVANTRVGDVIEGTITKGFQQGLVTTFHNEVRAPNNKVAGLFQGIEGLHLQWGRTMTPHQR